MKQVANRHGGSRVFMVSALLHATLLLAIGHVLGVAGARPAGQAAVIRGEVEAVATMEKHAVAPQELPPLDAPRDPLLPPLPEAPRVEEPPFEAQTLSEPLRDTELLRVPAVASFMRKPRRDPPPVVVKAVAAPPPPLYRQVAVAAPIAPVGLSRRAAPVAGNEKPRYPRQAAAMGIQGVTLLAVVVGADGSVLEVRVHQSSGSVILDREALRTVRGWGFIPALRNGVPVAATVLLPIRFTGS